jgi:Tol biopolymer transport system component
MKKYLCLFAVLYAFIPNVNAEETDARTVIELSPQHRVLVLTEMRQFLSGLQQITEIDGGLVLPFWSPSGDRIFSGNLSGEAMVVDLDGQWPIRDAYVLPVPEGQLGVQPAGWTGDGRGVIVAGQGSDVTASTVYVFDLESEQYRLVSDLEVRMDFHFGLPVPLGDGKNLLFSDAGMIMLMNIETGRARVLLEPISGSKFVAPKISPDRSELYFLRLEEEADLWVARSRDAVSDD